MEASALTHASRGGLLARRSPLLRFEPDERLVKLIRAGHDGAFEVLFNRYNSRLLAFCTSMVRSRQDAEDVLQEVFASAHAAMLRDDRPINVRPWLYRIARNRCLNHLRKPVPEGQDSMDIHPHQNGTTTAEEVQHREELRQVLADVRTLPETQRTALLLREIDQLSYEEIAQAMDTTVPSIKSLLVRARIGLAESSQARLLTCGEVQVELAEAAEGIAKASGPARKHVRSCESCNQFRTQVRADRKALAALFPVGPLALIKGGFLAKLFGGGSGAGAGAGAAGTAGAGAVGAAGAAGAAGAGAGAAVGGASAAGGISGGMGVLGSALGAKAVAGVATAALITAGAVEVHNIGDRGAEGQAARDVPATVVKPPTRADANRRQVAEFHPATVPAPVAGALSEEQDATADQPAPATTPPAEDAAPTTGTGEGSVSADPAIPDAGAEISGVGQVPAAITPSEGQNPGSATQPPATPTVPVTTPPTTGPPPTAEPPPTTGPPPVEPPPVTPVPATPTPAPATPPAPVGS